VNEDPAPRWALVTSAGAPLLLIGGWTVAAALQPAGFDPVVDTISALAASDAAQRWLMTAALYGVGACHLGTALALRPAAVPGRVLLAVAGAATLGVAAAPLPSGDGRSAEHAIAAGVSFVALAVWPALAGRQVGSGLLRRRVAVPAAVGLLGLVGWFFAELAADTGRVGLSERVAAGAEALWPLVTVLAARRAQRGWFTYQRP
jgi:Protein of unknown function (DUF998)